MPKAPPHQTRDTQAFRQIITELDPQDQFSILHEFPKTILSHDEHRMLCAELVRNIDYLDTDQRVILAECIERGFQPKRGKPTNPRHTIIISWLLWARMKGLQKLPRGEIIQALVQSSRVTPATAQRALDRAKREFNATMGRAQKRSAPKGP